MIYIISIFLLGSCLLGSAIAGSNSFIFANQGKENTSLWGQQVALLGIGMSWVCSMFLWTQSSVDLCVSSTLITWMHVGDFSIRWGLLLDQLSLSMAGVVTTISLCVHIYSLGYLKSYESADRFFCYLSLFTFMMLLLVMADNVILMFAGWEGVGLLSYLLIGFWADQDKASLASSKAFLMNRFGDAFLLLGLFMLYDMCQSFHYQDIRQALITEEISTVYFAVLGCKVKAVEATSFCLFVGMIVKSAHLPFHLWLPDSMEGPTPVSALLHAATMVTAGLFLGSRLSFLFAKSEYVSSLMVGLGCVNIILMGLIALFQDDIKKVLAYSTLSQLGYMMLAFGLGYYSFSFFHLISHAFFKSLLFLSAGSLITALEHEQSLDRMGGLIRIYPKIAFFMGIGLLSLMGVPPLGGFFSKELIILAAVEEGETFFVTMSCWIGVMLTCLYSFRLFYKAFLVKGVRKHKTPFHSFSMESTLALLSLGAIFVGVGCYGFFPQWFSFIFPMSDGEVVQRFLHNHGCSSLVLEGFYSSLFLIFLLAWGCIHLFYKGPCVAWREQIIKKHKEVFLCLQHGFYLDYLVSVLGVRYFLIISQWVKDNIEERFIDSWCVHSWVQGVRFFGYSAQKIQTGTLTHYIIAIVSGICMMSLYLG